MTKYQDLENAMKRSWKLKNAKVVPVMMKNLTEILKNHPEEYYDKRPTVGSCTGLSDDPEESHQRKTSQLDP